MKMKFIGMDESMGFKYGQVYDVVVYITDSNDDMYKYIEDKFSD